MSKIEEEREMVGRMKESGLTLAEIADELSESISWVYSRLNEKYFPKKKEEIKLVKASEEERIGEIDKELEALEKEEAEICEELNFSPYRSEEELEKYRLKRDEEEDRKFKEGWDEGPNPEDVVKEE